jgi:uncharacterized protein YyaL (SSP411 family)
MNSKAENGKANRLIHEDSPYLLQHAYNPVEWFPWGQEAIDRAKMEDKLLLISIGYSACHWCHVMEHESFEDPLTAEMMNDKFICVKVDREERPDIDQLYMTAVHLMGGRGGWPLNCFALPDGRPVYGGTYFPKAHWQKVLNQVNSLYTESKAEMLDYAARLASGIQQTELFKIKADPNRLTHTDLNSCMNHWIEMFDDEEGGPNKAPKFPLPNNYDFLLRYGFISKDSKVLKHVELTLDKMAAGGIYDQVGGGFSRYSTDIWWKVPHFEKMLYDNGQLLSLYANAFHGFGKKRYLEICKETAQFVQRELLSPEGGFYSALDADSEGVEGKFYVWSIEELKSKLSDEEFQLTNKSYFLDNRGFWEHENYILMRKEFDETSNELERLNNKLLHLRSERIRPGLDDKILLSWNAMMLKGLADASRVSGDTFYLELALKNLSFIEKEMILSQGELWHSWKNGTGKIDGFLEDYVWLIEAYIALYQATWDENYLFKAKKLTEKTIEIFPEAGSGLLYYTSERHGEWVARQMETSDNVIPASNSMLANILRTLGIYFGKADWVARSKEMLQTVKNELIGYGPGYSNWLNLVLHDLFPHFELVVTGENAIEKAKELMVDFYPQVLVAVAEQESRLPINENRILKNETYFYLCRESVCERPSRSVSEIKNKLSSEKENHVI